MKERKGLRAQPMWTKPIKERERRGREKERAKSDHKVVWSNEEEDGRSISVKNVNLMEWNV